MIITDAELDNRFSYHAPKDSQPAQYEELREGARQLALLIVHNTPACPEQVRAINHLDEAVMLANAAIARHG